jgi:hypothetical protein
MSLFDFIAQKLKPSHKVALYEDKTVCLCLYRVEFTPIEQQVLLRLALMSNLGTSGEEICTFKIRR